MNTISTNTIRELTCHEEIVYNILINHLSSLTAKEITHRSNINLSSMHRILNRLTKAEILITNVIQNVTSYNVNIDHDIFLYYTLIEMKKLNSTGLFRENLYLDKAMQLAAEEIPKYVSTIGGTLFLLEKETKLIRAYEMAHTKIGNFILKVVQKKFRSLTTPYDEPLNNVARCIAEDKIIIGNKVGDFIYPAVSMGICNLIQAAIYDKTIIAAPIKYNNHAIAGLMIAVDNRFEETNQQFLDLVTLFTQKISISLMIAKKLDEMKNIYVEINNLRKLKEQTTTWIERLYR